MSEHIEDPLTRDVSSWWPPIRRAVETGLAKHKKNSLLAAKTLIPAKARRQLKELKDAGMIPGMKRVKIDSPWHFRRAYDRLISHGGRPDASPEEQTPIKELLAEEPGAASAMGKAILAAVLDDRPELSAAVRFGSREGILTKEETRRWAELKPPRGWINGTLLEVTRSEHERLKRERPKLVERVEVIEIPDEVERERLELERKLNEARVTELVFHPNFDTGKMDASLEGPVPDDLLRNECSRAGRNLWYESQGGPPVSGSPAKEVIAVQRAFDVVARLKQDPQKQWPKKDEIGKRLIALVESMEHPERLVLAKQCRREHRAEPGHDPVHDAKSSWENLPLRLPGGGPRA